MTLTAKFKKDVQTLRGAANGDFYLDVKNPKLYKKVRRSNFIVTGKQIGRAHV